MTASPSTATAPAPEFAAAPAPGVPAAGNAAFTILISLSFCHLLNDTMQSLISATYPVLKQDFHLNFVQVGLITLAFQMTASLLQPVVGLYTDRRPMPYSLAVGMGASFFGLLLLSVAGSFAGVVIAAAMVGLGSSVFHPESSRVARMASGGRHGMAQSVFQVGGNTGSAIGPLLAALIVVPNGRSSIAWFSAFALLAIVILWRVGGWYSRARLAARGRPRGHAAEGGTGLSRGRVVLSICILVALIFSKYFYLASLNTYYTFYLIQKFHISVQSAQVYLFVFLAAVAVGTLIGGPVGDRIGRKYVIWGSILGVLPFTLMLPYAGLFFTCVLSVIIGLVLASAFSAILVYAQELMPGHIGTVSGIFFGFAFGMGGIGAAVLGDLADRTSITFVYHVCAFLPLIGLLTAFLPSLSSHRRSA
ncbi:MAG TPA: MFS transporter [Acetobacteraceae bacterium]|jgi:FSR family fosmidomycin resistance protein-like MFS transporter